MNPDHLKHQAVALLREACSSYGILASSYDKENYRRLWARDSMIAGLAALLVKDDITLEGFRKSVETLAEYQHPNGMIPSNVLPSSGNGHVSYGGLAGRIDATSWFVAGACLYVRHYPDEAFKNRLRPHLLQALKALDLWEFNGKGLVYTPLSGNWTDEFPVEGHTLYDNVLRLWALTLYAYEYSDEARIRQARRIKEKILINFWPDKNHKGHPAIYHPREFTTMADKGLSCFAGSVGPTGYQLRFDAAGHGLILLLGLASEKQIESVIMHVENIFRELGVHLLPCFWPVITPEDVLWHNLKNNFTFYFKNKPYHFHNGGIWPVWTGLFGLGIGLSGKPYLAETMLQAWLNIEDEQNIRFSEYITSDTFMCAGKERLCFSASGMLFLLAATDENVKELLVPYS